MAASRAAVLAPVVLGTIIYIIIGFIGGGGSVQATHFRGGTISWKPSDSFSLSYREVIFTFKLGWRLSRVGCDEKAITKGTLVGEDARWFCMYGCKGVIASTREKCTEFNLGEDWMYGSNSFKRVFDETDEPIEISYMECCWLTDLVVGSGGEWALTTTLNLGIRSDTGRPNSSPITAMAPMITLRAGVADVIDLAVRDSDGDKVTCRLGRHVGECGTICSLFPEFTLDEENCLVHYNPVSNTTGKVPVAIMVEDHHRSNDGIYIERRKFSMIDPLSAVPVQFLVILQQPPVNCSEKPAIQASIPPTNPVKVRPGKKFKFTITSTPCDRNSSIDEFILIAPLGTRKSPILFAEGIYSTEITWTPEAEQDGSNLICVTARSSDGVLSEKICITVDVPKATAFCSVIGGPHFITFDKARYDFYGMCRYQLMRTLPSAASELTPFDISLWNEQSPGANGAVRIGTVTVGVTGQEVKVDQRRNVYLDNRMVSLPVRMESGLRVESSGRGISITLSLALRMYIDSDTLSIQLPQSYSGHVEGLCGNFNGDSSDDMFLRGSTTPASNEAEFAKSFQIDNDDRRCNLGYARLHDTPCPNHAVAASQCNILHEENGCFAECHEIIEPKNFYDNCVNALCAAEDAYSALDVHLRAYADACQREAVLVCDWRSKLGISLECEPNSHYEKCSKNVAATCADSESTVSSQVSDSCVEGCVCNEGYLLSGSSCVPESECGCVINNSYYPKGFTYRSDDCLEECVCGEECKKADQCGKQASCQKGTDGFHRCIEKARTRATCKAVTDLHYRTFDGTEFNALGTCAYIMVRSKRNSTKATSFTVVAVNEKVDQNKNISTVKEVHVHFGDGHTLTFQRGPRIILNDKEINPGSSIYGVDIRRIGKYVVADFNFGLVVRWDGVDRLRISAWSPLRYMVEGLCGDFDGNPENDFAVRQTKENLPDPGSFVESWRIEGYGTDGCRDHPGPEVPQPACLDKASLARYQAECSILSDPRGSIGPCHEYVNPMKAFNDCVYDLCANDGDKNIKQRIIASYTDDCLEESGSPSNWRDVANLTVTCINGGFSSCMEQCQPTCTDPDATACLEKTPNQLGTTCVEGCVCAPGLLLSGNECVKPENCGCSINGRYEKKGFSFATGNCTQTCTCNGPENLECGPTKFGCERNRDKCSRRDDGYFECVHRLRRRATCKAVTDPHYMTFDRKRFDSMGTCAYIMVRSKSSYALTPFRVVAVNEQPEPDREVSHVKEVWVNVGDDLVLSFTNGGIVRINDQVVNAGTNMSGVQIQKVGRFIVAVFDFGLTIRWDGEDRLRVSAWARLRGLVEGLCGDFDDKQWNDYMTPEGELVTNTTEFVNSWQIDGYDSDGCRKAIHDNPPPICPDEVYQDRLKNCSSLSDKNSLYAACHPFVDPEAYVKDCAFDMCAYDDPKYKQKIFEEYRDECQKVNINLPPDKLLDCMENSHFENCVDQCQPSCTDPDGSKCTTDGSLGDYCVQDCVCNEGYILSGKACVPDNKCGCVAEDGKYLPLGFKYRTKDCTQDCECTDGGILNCSEATSCPQGYMCRVDDDGYNRCLMQIRRRATCKAVTDPHYGTFDGVNYDSMGTCAYTMARSKEGATVTNFRVVAVNEQPEGRVNVSYVKEAYVHVGDDITVTFKAGPVITINGEVVLPGTTIFDIKVKKIGRFTTAIFPFGLMVKWDGIDRLRLIAWAQLKGMMEGLCGDFNDDPDNDFMLPDGEVVPDVNEFVNSWKVDGYGTEGCRDAPGIQESPCESPEKLAEFRESCRILISPGSPLLPCQDVKDPQSAYNDCVFDLCAYDGDPMIRQRVISSFVEDCREEDLENVVPDELKWMDPEIESGICKENSHYDECMSQCQPTCSEPDTLECIAKLDELERLQCVDGCKCDDGYLLSGEDCVPAEDCGCEIEGRYVEKGFTYVNKNCTVECECVGKGEVKCRSTEGCGKGLRCRINDEGQRACIPHIRRRATCKAVTDPHYMTFDGVKFDSMGTCAYTMVRSKDGMDETNFRVVAVNEQPKRANQNVSHVKEVYIHVGDGVTLTFKAGPVVRINGEVVLPGTTLFDIEVKKIGRFTAAVFPFGLTVKWDGIDRLRISAWGRLKGMMEGLCGDFNDNPENDFTQPDGAVVTNVNDFVNSWKVDGYGTEGCRDPPPDQESPCDSPEKLAEFKESCRILISPDSPLVPCHQLTDPNSAFNDCVFDLCAYNGDPAIRERVISSYVEDCREEDVESPDGPGLDDLRWMDPEIEAGLCKENSQYSGCLSQCQPTCSEPDSSRCIAKLDDLERLKCVEGCKCQDGFLLSGEECVPVEECGCEIEGRYVEKGYTYMNRNCTVECKCDGNGEVSCRSADGCGKGMRCRFNGEGRRACIPHIRRRATCAAVTDPHYLTFDGRKYDSMGTCAYIMARSRADANVTNFRVVALNEQPEPHRIVSHVKEVYIHVGRKLKVSFSAGPVVRVNDEVVLPGSTVEGVQIRKVGRFTIAEFDFGLVVKWDGIDRLRVMAWAVLKNKMEGLCGDFNDDPSNDFLNPRGVLMDDVDKFVRSWKTNEYSPPECLDSVPGNLTASGCADPVIYNRYKEECFELMRYRGSYYSCHDYVKPDPYFDDCVFDLCGMDGDPSVKERVFLEYTGKCLEENPPFFNPNLTQSCPENTLSQLRMDPCQPTCNDLDASECKLNSAIGDEVVAGCECIEGMVRSGEKCVLIEECGCMIEGRYREKGFRFLNSDCNELCECTEKDTVVCLPTHECRTTERCTKTGGEYKCTPFVQDRATCKAVTDPHHTTFDGKTFDSTGTCAYIMVRSRPGEMTPNFRVVAVNEPSDENLTSALVKEVHVEIGEDFRLEIMRDLPVRINGVFYNPGSTVSGAVIRHIGLFTVIEFDFGLVVRWDGISRLRVTVMEKLKGKVDGLCGFYNDDASDDFTKEDGEVTTNTTDFISSWKVPGYHVKKCKDEQPIVHHECDSDEVLAGYREKCNLLLDPVGPFAPCHKVVDPQPAVDACVSDLCSMNGDLQLRDKVFTSYVHDCMELSEKPEVWRMDVNHPVGCPANSRYSRCMDQCQPTCSDTDASQCKDKIPFQLGKHCVEGCQCEDGFYLSAKKCVPIKKCGCLVGGVYYTRGYKYKSADCKQQCVCVGENVFECSDVPEGCLENQNCRRSFRGDFQCMPIGRRRATCLAITDPHYTTFDGTKYDAQGVCAYTMVRTKSDATAQAFTVVAVNEQPLPGTNVAHVKEIHVSYDDVRVSFHKGPVLKLNDEVVNPGTTQSGIDVRKVGRFLTAVFDFGLTVRWDGTDRVRIIAFGTLRNQVEGMCGDFNDDPSNDLSHGVTGEVVTDIDEFVNSWRVGGYDDKCPTIAADFLSEIPAFECDNPTVRERYERDCGVLVDPNGALNSCLRIADATAVHGDCVLDMCAYEGDPFIKERVVSDFSEGCREAGGNLDEDWRKAANLTDVACPTNSHFVTCMPACQPSCDDPDGSECNTKVDVGGACVEGCKANDGYLLSADLYVPRNECGCKKDGRYYTNGHRFYTKACATLCECENGIVTCRTSTCRRDEECIVNSSGNLGCVAIETSTCQAWGSTHFLTFDGRQYDHSMGCTYVFAQRPIERGNPQSKAESFIVMTTIQPSKRYSEKPVPKNVRVRLPDQDISILLRPEAEVGGVNVHNWRSDDKNRLVTIDRRGTFTVVETFFGLVVAYDGMNLRITLPKRFAGTTNGLCGNYNGDASDDFTLDDGTSTDDVNLFAADQQSYKCKHKASPAFECTEGEKAKWGASDKCGAILDPKSEFADCGRKLRASEFFDKCVHDVCMSGGSNAVLSQALKTYAHECMAADAPVCDWRRKYLLQVACPVNSHYVGCTEACEETCGVSSVSRCRYQQVEDCVCDEGYMRSNGHCVPKANCGGCIVNRKSVQKGFTFRRKDCAVQCTCVGNGNVECGPADPCISRATCARDDRGYLQCLVKPRRKATCQVFGNAHFSTFDGSTFDSTATCPFVMARTRSDATVPEFSVKVDMKHSSNGNLSHAAEIIVTAKDIDLIMAQGRVVMVNGRRVSMGSSRGGIIFRKIGRDVVAIFDFGLILRWDGKQDLRIEAWRSLAGQLEGLCGDFDEDENNDFLTSTGVIETDISAFANSWRATKSGDGCRPSQPVKLPCDDDAVLSSYRSYCTDEFDGDLTLVSECGLFNLCVYEMCASNGDKDSTISNVYSFAKTCHEEYEEPDAFPTITAKDECAANSHYNECMEQCQPTCSDLTASLCKKIPFLQEKCASGCQCDEGYILDGEECVKPTECGCVSDDGEYYPNGYDSYLEGCQKKCKCENGTLSCRDVRCYSDQYCGYRNMTYGCHWTDGCKYSNGGCSQLCTWKKGAASCSCHRGYRLKDDQKTCEETDLPCNKESTTSSEIPKWKQNVMQTWLKKLDVYMEAVNKGAETGDPAYTCNPMWTVWLDHSDPDGTGDDESFELLRKKYPHILCEHPVAIEAQLADGRNVFASGLVVRTMEATKGLRCFNSDQRRGEKCGDFRVRFLCLEELI